MILPNNELLLVQRLNGDDETESGLVIANSYNKLTRGKVTESGSLFIKKDTVIYYNVADVDILQRNGKSFDVVRADDVRAYESD